MTLSKTRFFWATCLPLALGACAITAPPAQVPTTPPLCIAAAIRPPGPPFLACCAFRCMSRAMSPASRRSKPAFWINSWNFPSCRPAVIMGRNSSAFVFTVPAMRLS